MTCAVLHSGEKRQRSEAQQSSRMDIQKGGALFQVDGQPLEGYNNHQAVELLRNTGSVVRLKLARYKHAPSHDQLQQYDCESLSL